MHVPEATGWQLFQFFAGLVITGMGVLLFSSWQRSGALAMWGAGVATTSTGILLQIHSQVMSEQELPA